MKTIFRSLSMAAVVAVFAVAGAFAQNVCDDIDTPTAKYEAFTGLYNKQPSTIADKEAAIAAGKEFLEKWGACEAWAEQVKFVRPWIPKLEEQIKGIRINEHFKAFDKGMESKNWDAVFAAGKEIQTALPDKALDQLIVMGMIGFVESLNKNNKYNDESLRYADIAIAKINAGEPSLNKKYGVFQFAMGTKENALSELNYSKAHITYYGKGDKKGGLAQMYKVAQAPGSKQNYAPMFATMGDYYRAESGPIGVKVSEGIKRLSAAPEAEKEKINEEVKANVALFNGYLERAMDAYGRAWKFAKDDTPQGKTYKDNLLKVVKDLYEIRTDRKEGAEQWVATAIVKPLPDPTSTVEPVSDPDPTTTTTTTTGGTGIGAANGTGVGAANGTGVAPKAGPVAKKP